MIDDDRELRIAPVMTGGTSLAVWMGGVTAEIHRLVSSRPTIAPPERPVHRAPDPDPVLDAYRCLLELTKTRAQVDVITGTSAGGLNGTLLAAAWRLAVPPAAFDDIRTTWLDTGDLDRLLRSPRQGNPPSLLQGDDYFTPQIKDVLDRWAKDYPVADVVGTQARFVDLATTLTSVHPEQRTRTDDFGELLNEANHAHVLRFQGNQFTDGWTARLAIAARTSASIPGVFEPSYLPVTKEAADASGRPNLADHASFKTSKWAVDGGVVVNLPLTEAVERVFRLRAQRDVRRVILYVCPTPAGVLQPTEEPPAEMPTLRQSLATTVVAPRAEGISGDVDRLREHNRAVNHQRAARLALAGLHRMQDVTEVAGGLLEIYRDIRARTSVIRTVEHLQATQRRNEAVLRQQSDIERKLLYARKAVLPSGDEITLRYGAGDQWRWGISAVEQAVSIGLDLLSQAHRLGIDQPAVRASGMDGARLGPLGDSVQGARRRVHVARTGVESVRGGDAKYWEGQFEKLLGLLNDSGADTAGWASNAYRDHAISTDAGPVLERAHETVARALMEAAPSIRALVGPITAGVPADDLAQGAGARSDASASAIPEKASQAARDLLLQLAAVAPEGGDVTECGRRLLAFHVLQTVFVGEVVDREQAVELMQVSFNAPNCLDDRPPADKLAGPELARLGAFLKHSWRAHDWFWGRMDAAYRLVELLLDPARLRQLGRGGDDVVTAVVTILGRALTGAERDAVSSEVAFLDDGALPLPGALPGVTRLIAERLQLLIALKELPDVGKAIEKSNKLGAAEPDDGEFRRALAAATGAGGAVNPDNVPALVKKLHVGRETVGDELGRRMLNRVGLRGLSVAVNVLAGPRTGLPVVSRLAARLKSPLHALNSVVSVMLSGTRLGQAVTVFVLAAAGAIVAMRLVGVDVPSGLLVVAELLLAATFLAAMLRSGFFWQAVVLAVGVVVVGLAIAGDQVGDVVYTRTAASTAAVVGTDARITLEPGSVLRLENGERVNDVEASAIVVRKGGGRLLATAGRSADASWKKWGLTGGVSLLRTGAPLLLLLVAFRLAKRSPRIRVAAVGAGLAASLAVVVWGPRTGKALVTGTEGKSGLKDALVDVATFLNGIELTVIILVLVLLPMALAYGFDMTVRRWVRGVRPGRR